MKHLWELQLDTRLNSITGNEIYELRFGNIVIKTFDNYTQAIKQFEVLIDQDSDTANGFLNLWNSLSFYEQVNSNIAGDIISRIRVLGIEQDKAMGLA
jgi:hypothetical protein